MTVSFTVFGIPASQGSKVRTRHGGMREASKRLAPWRANVEREAVKAMMYPEDTGRVHLRPALLAGPLRVHLLFVLPRPKAHYGTGKRAGVLKLSAPIYPTTKPDVDKCARAILDACTGVVFRDDSQVASLHASKRYGEPARVEVTVSTLTDEVEEAAA